MTHSINGRVISFAPDTEFLVQTGRNKGPYRNIRRIIGDLVKAEEAYNKITLHPGMKKRLLLPTSSYPSLLQSSKP
jgi:hypothetical protein